MRCGDRSIHFRILGVSLDESWSYLTCDENLARYERCHLCGPFSASTVGNALSLIEQWVYEFKFWPSCLTSLMTVVLPFVRSVFFNFRPYFWWYFCVLKPVSFSMIKLQTSWVTELGGFGLRLSIVQVTSVSQKIEAKVVRWWWKRLTSMQDHTRVRQIQLLRLWMMGCSPQKCSYIFVCVERDPSCICTHTKSAP